VMGLDGYADCAEAPKHRGSSARVRRSFIGGGSR
jgi:hypothetical protein